MISAGMYVTHIHRKEWGVGKVLEGHQGTTLRLWFELGGERKIGSAFHEMLRRVVKPAAFHVPSVKSSPPKKAPSSGTDKFHRDYFSGRWEFPFSRSEKERFRTGHLMHQWTDRYPCLFALEDAAAASVAEKGAGRFFSWAAAVRLFEASGYHCLLNDYATPADERKKELVRKLCGEENARFMEEAAGDGRFPDLLVFTPDHGEWFFCEVKAPGDTVRKSEDSFFPKLAERTGAAIYLVVLLPR